MHELWAPENPGFFYFLGACNSPLLNFSAFLRAKMHVKQIICHFIFFSWYPFGGILVWEYWPKLKSEKWNVFIFVNYNRNFMSIIHFWHFQFFSPPYQTPSRHNHTDTHEKWLHLTSWNLLDFQHSWESKMKPSVAKVCNFMMRYVNPSLIRYLNYLRCLTYLCISTYVLVPESLTDPLTLCKTKRWFDL